MQGGEMEVRGRQEEVGGMRDEAEQRARGRSARLRP